MKHGTLLYDTYRAAAHQPQRVAQTMQDTSYAPLYDAVTIDASMAPILDAARVYVLTLDAVQVIVDAAQRLQPSQLPIPRPPALPMWIEVDEQRVLRIEGMAFRFSGILLFAEGERVVVQFLGAGGAPLALAYIPNSGQWQSPLIEASPLAPPDIACQHRDCPIRERESHKRLGGVFSRDVLLADAGLTCTCFGLRQDMLLLITAFLAFLTADGVEREEIVVQPPAQPRRARKQGATPLPRNPIRYQHLSLTNPTTISVRRLPSGQIDVQHRDADADVALSREISKKAHFRLLIAGPGQRWLKTDVVLVHRSKPFQRRLRGNTTRFIVEE